MVMSVNIEGLSSAKQQILAELCANHMYDVLCIQETHRRPGAARPRVPGMNKVERWCDANSLTLIHDPKLPKLFNSARWKQEYNSDLSFVSTSNVHQCKKLVLELIPKTQHRPIAIKIKTAVSPQEVPFRRRYNLNGKGNSIHRPSKAKITDARITEYSLTSPFTMEELMKGINILKNNKAADLNDMLCEQRKHQGPKATVWLKEMMNNILVSNKFPMLWSKSKMIAIQKPGKDSYLPKSYRPISLLCHTYKVLEPMILNRMNPITDHTINKEQA